MLNKRCIIFPAVYCRPFVSQGRTQQFCLEGFLLWHTRERHWVMVQVLRWRFLDSGLPSPGTVYSQAFSGQFISVKYPRRTAGRGLDNLGVRMRFLLPPPPPPAQKKQQQYGGHFFGYLLGTILNYNRNVTVKSQRVSLPWWKSPRGSLSTAYARTYINFQKRQVGLRGHKIRFV